MVGLEQITESEIMKKTARIGNDMMVFGGLATISSLPVGIAYGVYQAIVNQEYAKAATAVVIGFVGSIIGLIIHQVGECLTPHEEYDPKYYQ